MTALLAARHRFADAATKLIDDTWRGPGHLETALFQQLLDAIGGVTRARSGGAGALPVWPDALDLADTIVTETAHWPTQINADGPTGSPTLGRTRQAVPIRLRAIQAEKWRPQDAQQLDTWALTVNSWCQRIIDLLNPAPTWHLPNPCPACGARIIHRPNSGGEYIRKPALQITRNGCECQACHHIWSPQYFEHLALVLAGADIRGEGCLKNGK